MNRLHGVAPPYPRWVAVAQAFTVFQAAYAATQPNYEAQRDCFFWAYVEYAFFCAMLLDAPKGRRVGRALMPDKPQQI